MLAREAERTEREVHNDEEATRWEVEAPDGWGGTCPSSPILVSKSWPSARVVENGTWPLLTNVVPLRPDGWPVLSPPVQDGISVTIEVQTTVKGSEGHSACRSLLIIGYLSVPDLLSSLCHNTVSTSIRSCAPRRSGGRVDSFRVYKWQYFGYCYRY
jgi:hypothetical protein